MFAIYVLMLVARWLKNDIGGLEKMAEANRKKAKLLYDVLDAHPDFYRGHARPDSRSMMNVTWRLPSEELEKAFLKEASRRELGRPERPPLGGRHSRFDLQRHAAATASSRWRELMTRVPEAPRHAAGRFCRPGAKWFRSVLAAARDMMAGLSTDGAMIPRGLDGHRRRI